MEETLITDEDWRAALVEMKTYVDITEDDLKKIYAIALKHAKERLAQAIPVREVMTQEVVAVTEDSEIREVIALLSQNRISGLPVVDRDHRVLGVISEADLLTMAGIRRDQTFKDILRYILGEAPKTRKTGDKARDFMTAPAITVKPDTDIRAAARILNEKRIKRLPVVDEENRLVGLISRADLVRVMGQK